LLCREDHSSLFFTPGSALGHALSESYKRKLAMAAEYIGGKPRQGLYDVYT